MRNLAELRALYERDYTVEYLLPTPDALYVVVGSAHSEYTYSLLQYTLERPEWQCKVIVARTKSLHEVVVALEVCISAYLIDYLN